MTLYKKYLSLLFVGFASLLILASCDENVTDNDNNNPINNDHSGTITTNETWAAGTTHNIDGCLNVDGATLTIEQGTKVIFGSNGCLQIRDGATLMVNGTESAPVLFTGLEKQPGYWRYIYFKKGSSNNSKISNAIIEYGGGYADYSGAIDIDGSSPTIENTTIRNSKYHGLVMDRESMPVLNNNTITANMMSPIRAHVENAHTIGTGDYSGNQDSFFSIQDGSITGDRMWANRTIPYRLESGAIKINNAELSIAPGTVVEMGSEARIELRDGGSLMSKGTTTDPITITGALKQNGYWRYIWFYDGASNSSEIDNTIIEYGGGYGDDYGMIEMRGTSPTITNSTIRNSAAYGISMDSESYPTLNNNIITQNTTPVKAKFNNAYVLGAGDYSGNTNDFLYLQNEKLSNDATLLKQNVPYRLTGNNTIENGTLTIQPGTVIQMDNDAHLNVKSAGAVKAIGTSSEKITFTGAVPQKGYWRYIWFDTGSNNANNVFDNVVVEYGGGYGDNYGTINVRGSSPTIRNSTIRNSMNWGIYMRDKNSQTVLENNIYEGNDGGDVYWPE